MAEIVRNRTIRPSTRLETSSYKIDTKSVSRGDILVVNIDHETKFFHKTYKFNGNEVADKNSISFRVNDLGDSIDIFWRGATPIGLKPSEVITTTSKPPKRKSINKVIPNQTLKNEKTSFSPISNEKTTVLILGTVPGDKSIELGEYYGHPRNRFWKIISTITKNDLPHNYFDKKQLLLKTKIGIWDVAHKVNRIGSLDSAIENEEPNDIDKFIERHKNLKVIAFNGKKSKVLFDKYFNRKNGIKYISLPSSSPANTTIDFDIICEKWQQIVSVSASPLHQVSSFSFVRLIGLFFSPVVG